jgi:UDP-N-acetylglucosamine acyltransferase
VISVHSTAVVSPSAVLGEGVEIGPYAVVESGVEIGAGTRILGHCVITGRTRLGERNTVFPFAVLGADPQDRSYAGDETRLEIGTGNVFREQVTIHRGTAKGAGVTTLGSGSLFMVGSHVAHDAIVGDQVTLTNGTLVGGHAELANHVVTGGAAAIAPFVRIGEGAFLAAGAMVERDVPPFVIAAGNRAVIRTLNRIGLRRRGTPDASIRALARAFRMLFRSAVPRATAILAARAELSGDPYVTQLLDFLEAPPLRARK